MTPSSPPSPPSLVVALLAEAALGLLAGAILAPVAAIGIAYIAQWTGLAQQLGMGLLTVQVFVGLAGLVVGLALGIHLVGRRMRPGGNPWRALLGGLIAILPVILFASRGVFGGLQGAALWGIILSVFGALIGYNLRRGAP